MATTTPERVHDTTAPPLDRETAASPLDRHEPPTQDTAGRSGKATASFIVGIVSVVAAIIPILGLILGITATSLGGVAKGETRRLGKSNRWMALAGLALGIVAIVASVGIFIAGLASAT